MTSSICIISNEYNIQFIFMLKNHAQEGESNSCAARHPRIWSPDSTPVKVTRAPVLLLILFIYTSKLLTFLQLFSLGF